MKGSPSDPFDTESSDLPALADASDCDTSTCSESPKRKKKPSSSFTVQPRGRTRFRPDRERHRGRRDKGVGSVSSTSVLVASDTSSATSLDLELDLQPTDTRRSTKRLDSSFASRGCAGLLCISELLSWGDDSSTKDETDPSASEADSGANFDSVNDAQDAIDAGTAQRLIEFDILKHMCCSEGYWRNEEKNFDSDAPFLCGFSERSVKRCENCRGITVAPIAPIQKISNRNAYMPKKARMRIESLRQSGLGRDFSFAPVFDYLQEEATMLRNEEEDSSSATTQYQRALQVSPPIRLSQSMHLSSKQKKMRGESLFVGNPASPPRFNSQACCKCEVNNDLVPHTNGLSNIMSALGVSTHADAYPKPGEARKQMMISVPSFDSYQSEVELCYDSDPGTERNVSSRRSEETKNNNSFQIESALKLNNFDTFNTTYASADKQRIQELASGIYNFIWHPKTDPAHNRDHTNSPPLWIKSWFEMGSCLKSSLIQPKFVWRAAIKPSKKRSLRSIQKPQSVELLNIVRILSPSNTSVDRNIYPFVKTKNAFVLVTSTKEEYLFEAQNEEEKDKFVFCMKIMVARLASKIIVGDRDVFNEFFSPSGNKMEDPILSEEASSDVSSSDSDPKEAPIANKRMDSICEKIVAPVNSESGRKDELWGRT